VQEKEERREGRWDLMRHSVCVRGPFSTYIRILNAGQPVAGFHLAAVASGKHELHERIGGKKERTLCAVMPDSVHVWLPMQ
jgi:hypothetical protein